MLLPDPIAPDSWPDEITADAIGEMNGAISLYNPADNVTTPYDPVMDTGGETVITYLLQNRRARIQQLKSPQDASGADQTMTKRVIRFQIEILSGDPLITANLTVRVDDGGKDKTLEQFTYKVQSAVNSSHAALRTIEAISELVPTAVA